MIHLVTWKLLASGDVFGQRFFTPELLEADGAGEFLERCEGEIEREKMRIVGSSSGLAKSSGLPELAKLTSK
jgi:hypothetical protein